MKYKTIRLILGDQLNINHSWFKQYDSSILYVLMEVKSEALYVQHHIQKIIAFFMAMRSFAEELKSRGHQVQYISINDINNKQNFKDNIHHLFQKYKAEKLEYQLPDEYRLDILIKGLENELGIKLQAYDTEHFYTSRQELALFFRGKKTYLMESFYRYMRKKHNLLMNGEEPLTGKWNYDAENRKKISEKDLKKIPKPKINDKNVTEILRDIEQQKIETIGVVNSQKFIWYTTRSESLELLQYFVQYCLPEFGMYQDAMHTQHWSLYHSRLSFALNVKLISPKEVVNKAIEYWQNNSDKVSIAQIEGFVRQIIGWREYMRGIYWAKMPEYESLNFFGFERKLPDYYWSGNTKMNCLKHAIQQSLDYAYAHHIQRLMITGNFALLAGIHPDEVDNWYLGIYIDAIQWVEITNTRGMSQFADGGIVGTKPYVSSANYIAKMSNYCDDCFYNKNLKTGDKACPFNSLYWNFYNANRKLLERNPRIGMMYNIWDKMSDNDKKTILNQAEYYLENVEKL